MTKRSVIQEQTGNGTGLPDSTVFHPGYRLGFVKVPAGPFLMGEGEKQHPVHLPSYYIACYPVTVAQFRAFIETESLSEKNGQITCVAWKGNSLTIRLSA